MRKIFLIAFAIAIKAGFVYSQNCCLRFYGNGVQDIDRVKISIDNPEKAVDVGFDFTIEFQMKASLSDNPLGANAKEGENDDWTLGHVIIDRDIFGNGDYGDYGISLANGRIAFGVNNGSQSYTVISNTSVADNKWHHIAVTRNHQTGELQIFIDGKLDKKVTTNVTGDISYRNNRPFNWPNEPFIVIGAEKHDYDKQTYPSYSGFFDELRYSNIVRYTSNYTPVDKFTDDANTVGLYHFDECKGIIVYDHAKISGNNSDGKIFYGGSPGGPVWYMLSTNTENKDNQVNQTKFLISDNILFILEKEATTTIYSSTGQLIIKTGENKINIDRLPKGLYFIQINEIFHKFLKF